MKKDYQLSRLLRCLLLTLTAIAACAVFVQGQAKRAQASASSPEQMTAIRGRATRVAVINLAAVSRQDASPHMLAGELEEEIEPPGEQPGNLPVPADALISNG